MSSLKVIDEEECTPVCEAPVAEIVTTIKANGKISRTDVLLIEDKLGKGVLPPHLKNIVTAHPSSHGLKDVLNAIARSTVKKPSVNIQTVLSIMSSYVNNLMRQDLNVLIRLLEEEKVKLSSVYVPMSVAEVMDPKPKSVLDVPVTSLTRNGVAAKAYAGSGIAVSTLKYLETRDLCSFGMLYAISEYQNKSLSTIVAGLEISYTGTLGEYIYDYIKLLRNISSNSLESIQMNLSMELGSIKLGNSPIYDVSELDLPVLYGIISNDRYLSIFSD